MSKEATWDEVKAYLNLDPDRPVASTWPDFDGTGRKVRIFVQDDRLPPVDPAEVDDKGSAPAERIDHKVIYDALIDLAEHFKNDGSGGLIGVLDGYDG